MIKISDIAISLFLFIVFLWLGAKLGSRLGSHTVEYIYLSVVATVALFTGAMIGNLK